MSEQVPYLIAPRRDAVVFSLLAEDLATSAAAEIRLEAFDCRDLRLTGSEAGAATRRVG